MPDEYLAQQITNTTQKSHPLVDQLSQRLAPLGFECHAFLVEWYNAAVAPIYRLPVDGSRLACVVLSTPAMFERTFVPWLCRRYNQCVVKEEELRSQSVSDPLDSCMKKVIGEAASATQPSSTVLYDFDRANCLSSLTTNFSQPTTSFSQPSISCRRPAILMQPAAHVSAAVRYYCRRDAAMLADSWPEKRRVFGVCVHPRYGGWFAIRAVVVFEACAPDLIRQQPLDILSSPEQIYRLLSLFNDNWKDWRYRDVLGADNVPFPPHLRYSSLQRSYFETKPALRADIIRRIIDESTVISDEKKTV